MAKYVCVKTCFFRNRRWTPGETLEPSSGEVVPKWFAEKDKAPQAEALKHAPEPKTLFEAQKIMPPTLGELLD